MTADAAMRLMRAMRRLLVSRGLCGMWLPGEPTLCGLPLDHKPPHGQYGGTA